MQARDSAAVDDTIHATVHAIVGPTAVGKSALALELARRTGAEILVMDSMQVYRGLDVGTAKPSAAERAAVAHRLLDLADPGEAFTVARWLAAATEAERAARAAGARPLYVGGTPFYLRALLSGLFEGPEVDPALRASLEARAAREGGAALHAELAAVDPRSAARIHANDTARVVRALEVHAQTGRPLSSWQTRWGFHGAPAAGRPARLVGLTRPKAVLERRIRERAAAMLDAGWVDEARALRERLGRGAAQALGYAEALAFADGALDRETCIERIAVATRRLARRQRTWLKRFPGIVWLDLEEGSSEEHVARARAVLGW